MEKELKLEMIKEIKQLERELYLKRSRLSAIEVMESDTDDADRLLSPKEWKGDTLWKRVKKNDSLLLTAMPIFTGLFMLFKIFQLPQVCPQTLSLDS